MTHVLHRVATSRAWHHGPALLLAAGLGLLLADVPTDDDLTRTVVAVGALQAGLVLTWSAALGFRGYVGSLLIGAGAGAAADVVALRMGDLGLADGGVDDRLGPLAAVLAVAFLLAFVHQLTRRPPRVALTESLAGVTLLSAVVVAPSAYLVLAQLSAGPTLLHSCAAALGAALVVGHLVDMLLPYPRIVDGVPRGLLGFLAGTGAGMYAAVQTQGDNLVEQLGSLILGGVLGGLISLLAIGASYAAVERRGSTLAKAVVQATLPYAAAAPVAYFVAVLVSG